jgi:hypothetical protein
MSAPTELPTREEITQDISGWKSYTKSLKNIVDEVINESKNNIGVMKLLFETYVSPSYPDKEFNSFAVTGPKWKGIGNKITYDYHGVNMMFDGRPTISAEGNYFYVCDRLITVDERVIYNGSWQSRITI